MKYEEKIEELLSDFIILCNKYGVRVIDVLKYFKKIVKEYKK